MGRPCTGWFSFHRVWDRCIHLGIGLGWDPDDRTACLLVSLGFHLLIIGPHHHEEPGTVQRE